MADMKRCEVCGKEFKPRTNTQRYCKPKHLAHCEICGKEKEFASGLIYKDEDGKLFSTKACSTKCSVEKSKRTCLEKYGVENGAQAKEVQERIKKTNLEKYGVENPFQSKEIQEKIKKINLERYGTENAMQNQEIQEKTKKTNLERYGGVAPACSEEVREKMKETSLERYGVDNPFKSKEKQEKIRQTNLKKYGVDNPFKSKEIQDEIKAINLERYGAENVFQSEEIKDRIKQTNLDKYGVEYYSQTDEYKEKFQSTSLERYGTSHPMQSEEVKESHKKKFLSKYGVENPQQVEEIKKRTQETNLERYGATNLFASDYGKQKTKETNLEKYGVEYVSQSPLIQEKIIENNLEKYGVEHVFQAEEIKDKIRQTNLERYGVESFIQSHITNIDDWLNLGQFLLDSPNKYNCFDLVEYFNINMKTLRKRAINENLQDYIVDFYKLSEPEMQIKQLLDNRIPDIECIMHDRKAIAPLELDFYLPDHNLAIEVSPTYTHKYIGENDRNLFAGVSEKDYHYSKFKKCEEQGIELITIFDWEDPVKIIDLIENKIQPSLTVVYARKCQINYVDSVTKDHKEFLDKYHVLGRINNKNDSFTLELVYKNEVLGVAVFYPYKDDQLELKRLAFKDGATVVGGASKLVKNATEYKDNIEKIITFSDNNLGTGSVYRTIGFDLVEDNKYSCTFYNTRHDWAVKETSLWMVGADRLLKNFPGYKSIGTGEDLPKNDEIVMSYGFLPVYDCGYRKWELDLTS